MNKLLVVILLLLIIYLYYSMSNKEDDQNLNEGFTQHTRNDEIYAKLYNTVFNDPSYIEADSANIKKVIKNNLLKKDDRVAILDAGTGVGLHYKQLADAGYSTIGVDNNNQLLKYAKIRNQDGTFKLGDLTTYDLFKDDTFSHILCSTDTIHHNDQEQIDKIISNFYSWVKQGGIVMMHIFNRDKLDPAPREYSQYYHDDQGNKHALTYYDNFSHDATWEKTNNPSVFIYNEKVILPNEKVKRSKNVFYIPDKSRILKSMKRQGFDLIDIYDMRNIEVEFFDLYVFRK